jgi:lipopolysaccharide transport system permease protein
MERCVSLTTELLNEDLALDQVAARAEVATDDPPTMVVEPHPGWRLLDVRDLWRYRELLYFLAWRDVKVRYKQTVLGAAWAVLQPFATMLVFSLFLGRVVSAPGTHIAYPLFVFAAMLPWMFFANAISTAAQSVVVSQNLVTKVYFPRMIIPMGAVAAALVDFIVGVSMLVLMMVYYRIPPGWTSLLIPLLVGVLAIAALGVGSLLAALTVAYRDFRHVIPFMVQLWMFATPAIYLQADHAISRRWIPWLPLNPAYGLIVNFRAAALGQPLDPWALCVSGAVSILLLMAGCLYFRRVERSFADTI